MKLFVEKIKNLFISDEIKLVVGNIVQTPYGVGKIINIRKDNIVPFVIDLSYGIAYLNINDVQLCN